MIKSMKPNLRNAKDLLVQIHKTFSHDIKPYLDLIMIMWNEMRTIDNKFFESSNYRSRNVIFSGFQFLDFCFDILVKLDVEAYQKNPNFQKIIIFFESNFDNLVDLLQKTSERQESNSLKIKSLINKWNHILIKKYSIQVVSAFRSNRTTAKMSAFIDKSFQKRVKFENYFEEIFAPIWEELRGYIWNDQQWVLQNFTSMKEMEKIFFDSSEDHLLCQKQIPDQKLDSRIVSYSIIESLNEKNGKIRCPICKNKKQLGRIVAERLILNFTKLEDHHHKLVSSNVKNFLEKIIGNRYIRFLSGLNINSDSVGNPVILTFLAKLFSAENDERFYSSVVGGLDELLNNCDERDIEGNKYNWIAVNCVKFLEDRPNLTQKLSSAFPLKILFNENDNNNNNNNNDENDDDDDDENDENEDDGDYEIDDYDYEQDPKFLILTKPFSFSKIIQIVLNRIQLNEKPQDFFEKRPEFALNGKGENWLLFLLKNVYKQNGPESLLRTIQQMEITDNAIIDFQGLLLSNWSISKSKILEQTSVFRKFVEKGYPDEMEYDDNTSPVLEHIYDSIRIVREKIVSPILLEIILPTMEIFQNLQLEPFYALSNYLFDLRTDPNSEQVVKQLFSIYWPTITPVPFSEYLIENGRKCFLCKNNHVNFYEIGEEKMEENCTVCQMKINLRDPQNNFETKIKDWVLEPYSYCISRYPNINPLYTVRNLNPVVFRICRIILHSLLLPFVITLENASRRFGELINNCISWGNSQPEMIAILLDHLKTDFAVLSGLLNFSSEETKIYYHEILMKAIPKFTQSRKMKRFESFEKTDGRTLFETKFAKIYDKWDQTIRKRIQNNPVAKTELVEKVRNEKKKEWMFCIFQRNEIYQSLQLHLSSKYRSKQQRIT
ncbi:finger protein [Anaeramoeba ignava]|uniref:Finger protein n=1 Tax=Anaeramoeba ignava TaxID=1746090 RepID=A0A9Q0L6U0_ANAIG|nr:finger protein [Anaeramoeba ignava]